jgi:exopolysaccharide biosynthesis polyprenyl glycosylphosphotransferase
MAAAELPSSAPAEVRRRERIQRRALAVADLIAAAVATLTALVVFGDEVPTPLVLAMPLLLVLAAKLAGLYERDEVVLRKSTLEDASMLFGVVTLYAFGLWLLEDFVVVGGELGQRQVLGLWVGLIVLCLLGRRLARMLTARLSATERCIVMGDESVAEALREKFAEDGSSNAAVIDVVPLKGRRRDDSHWRPDDMHLLLRGQNIHRVIIAPDHADSDHVLDAIRAAKSLGVRVSLFPRMLEVVGSSVEFEDLGGVPILGVRPFGLSRSSQILKRSFDLAGSTLGLLVLSPLLALIAVAIKLDSPGPVFYRQRRIGRNDRDFRIVKFRTMVEDADRRKPTLVPRNDAAPGFFKITDDPRITRVGRWLRRTSLDELPQLLNVLRGDMSLVGPRPLISEEDAKIEGWNRSRLELTPGMTGHWQILGSSRVPLPEMVRIDYLYAVNWSLWSDVKLMLRTVPVMLRGQGR